MADAFITKTLSDQVCPETVLIFWVQPVYYMTPKKGHLAAPH
jgi:hypothetical protein